MRLLYGGIHKNVGFIVQRTGGYDRTYHIAKLSKELDIDLNTMTMLFKEASISNLSHYIGLLKQGVPIDEVFTMVDKDNRIIHARIQSAFVIMETLIKNGLS